MASCRSQPSLEPRGFRRLVDRVGVRARRLIFPQYAFLMCCPPGPRTQPSERMRGKRQHGGKATGLSDRRRSNGVVYSGFQLYGGVRSEEETSELPSIMRNSFAVF